MQKTEKPDKKLSQNWFTDFRIVTIPPGLLFQTFMN